MVAGDVGIPFLSPHWGGQLGLMILWEASLVAGSWWMLNQLFLRKSGKVTSVLDMKDKWSFSEMKEERGRPRQGKEQHMPRYQSLSACHFVKQLYDTKHPLMSGCLLSRPAVLNQTSTPEPSEKLSKAIQGEKWRLPDFNLISLKWYSKYQCVWKVWKDYSNAQSKLRPSLTSQWLLVFQVFGQVHWGKLWASFKIVIKHDWSAKGSYWVLSLEGKHCPLGRRVIGETLFPVRGC